MDTINSSFQKTLYYVVVGVSPMNNTACVMVTSSDPERPIPPVLTLQPTYDRPYAAYVTFTFMAPKKTVYNVIITNLKACGVYPNDDPVSFNPQRNPDNRFYTSLPISKLDTIISIVTTSIEGLSIELVNDVPAPKYTKVFTESSKIEELKTKLRPQRLLNLNGALILNMDGTTKIHQFSR